MTDQVDRRFGIMSVAILMAFVSLLGFLLGGPKGSPYTAFWIYAAYLSYKGDIKTLKSYLVVLIWITAIFAAGVFLFVDLRNLQWIMPGAESHLIFLVAIGIPLAIKIAILMRVNRLIGEGDANVHQAPVAADESGSNIQMQQNPIISSASKSANQPQIISEDYINTLYSQALEEAQSGERNKGLWAKCFAQNDGDENKAKAQYVRERVEKIQADSKKGSASPKPKTERSQPSLEERRPATARSFWSNKELKPSRPDALCPHCKEGVLLDSQECWNCRSAFVAPYLPQKLVGSK